ncbi:Transcriptional activator of proteases prtT [Grifola frondosa]|uniref:Transcriptional activator of proteases prtT n=1 Tax=Grifola frondosa TaxID=5627 RepID=A0A1C7MSQ5_GRIFR|nr:Transcriptional activator of proteases prtT [Grifola frondosa]
MDPGSNGSGATVKKQEEMEVDSKSGQKPDSKPAVRTLNRVPRACNACRKQKMRCEGAENPPCRRCRHAGLECLFEKPTREASLTGEAGLERIRSLEAHVADIRQTQTVIQNTLVEIATHLRGGSPGVSTPSTGPHPPQLMVDTAHGSSVSTSSGVPPTHGPMMNRQHREQMSASYQSPTMAPAGHRPTAQGEFHPPQVPPNMMYNAAAPGHNQSGQHSTTLPPFSSIESMGPPRSQPTNVSSMRYNAADGQSSRQHQRPPNGPEAASGSKRAAPPSSTVTSADSSEVEEDDGELPASGLVAPWEVLRGLADVAIERAAKENGGESESQSRARTTSPEPRQPRPAKRRKVQHKLPRSTTFPDVVTKKILSEADARELFRIFYHGCSTFLPIFDASVDTFDALHERSPFAVDCICMVAAKVRDGGGNPSDIFMKCLEEVQAISCATLFSPVTRQEAVQAMILVSGWSDNGWLSGGHAVRMAMELSMHKAWPELLKRMKANKASSSSKDRELVISARTWFCLYLFEHQMSYGTGRPAILKDDESIWQCRLLLSHPLAIEDDMRLVSTVELMAIRERVHNNLSPLFDRPVDEITLNVLHEADQEFRHWYATWDQAFSQKYEDAAFYRQSLQIQHLHAELFHNATALRGIDGPDDVQRMPPNQRELAIRSIDIGRQILDITVNSPSYREGMKYAVHYTHATATFSASFLLRLCRLFPDQCDIQEIRTLVERLSALLSEVPGKRYALTLQLMLKRFRKRKSLSTSRSPKTAREQRHRSQSDAAGYSSDAISQSVNSQQPISPTFDSPYSAHPEAMGQMHMGVPQQQFAQQYAPNIDHIWRGFEATANEQLPVWLSDQSLGGASFSANGIDAFLLPNDYLPPAPQIW